MSAGSDFLGRVGTCSGVRERFHVMRASVQGVMRGAIPTTACDLGVGVMDRSGAGVEDDLTVLDTELPCRVLMMDGARVVARMSDQTREAVARSGAAVHSSDRPTGLGIFVTSHLVFKVVGSGRRNIPCR